MRLYEINNTAGVFAGVHFSPETIEAIIEYQQENNIPNPLDSSEFHSTVVFNKSPLPNLECLDELSTPWKGTFVEMIILPSEDDNALCIQYESSELTTRWQQTQDLGATWSYPKFIPHITISYDVGNIDPKNLPPYTGPIEIIEEFCNPLDPDYEDKIKS